MKPYRKDEVLEMADMVEVASLPRKPPILMSAANMLRAFAETLGEPVDVPDESDIDDAPSGRPNAESACYAYGFNACREAIHAQGTGKREPDDSRAFKNFHRALCERFDYTHDEIDWRRDQVSLEEHIAKKIEKREQAGVSEAHIDALELARVALHRSAPIREAIDHLDRNAVSNHAKAYQAVLTVLEGKAVIPSQVPEGEVILEHSGCGNGVQVNQLTVKLYPGDVVVMKRGRLGKALTATKPDTAKE